MGPEEIRQQKPRVRVRTDGTMYAAPPRVEAAPADVGGRTETQPEAAQSKRYEMGDVLTVIEPDGTRHPASDVEQAEIALQFATRQQGAEVVPSPGMPLFQLQMLGDSPATAGAQLPQAPAVHRERSNKTYSEPERVRIQGNLLFTLNQSDVPDDVRQQHEAAIATVSNRSEARELLERFKLFPKKPEAVKKDSPTKKTGRSAERSAKNSKVLRAAVNPDARGIYAKEKVHPIYEKKGDQLMVRRGNEARFATDEEAAAYAVLEKMSVGAGSGAPESDDIDALLREALRIRTSDPAFRMADTPREFTREELDSAAEGLERITRKTAHEPREMTAEEISHASRAARRIAERGVDTTGTHKSLRPREEDVEDAYKTYGIVPKSAALQSDAQHRQLVDNLIVRHGPTGPRIRQTEELGGGGRGEEPPRPPEPALPDAEAVRHAPRGGIPNFIRPKRREMAQFTADSLEVILHDKRKQELFNDLLTMRGRTDLREKYARAENNPDAMTDADWEDMKDLLYEFSHRLALAEDMRAQLKPEDIDYMIERGSFGVLTSNLRKNRVLELVRENIYRMCMRESNARLKQYVDAQHALHEIRDSEHYRRLNTRTKRTFGGRDFKPEDINFDTLDARTRRSVFKTGLFEWGHSSVKSGVTIEYIQANREAMMDVLAASVSSNREVRRQAVELARTQGAIPAIGSVGPATFGEASEVQQTYIQKAETVDAAALAERVKNPEFRKKVAENSGYRSWEDIPMDEREDASMMQLSAENKLPKKQEPRGWFSSLLSGIWESLFKPTKDNLRAANAFA